MTGPEHYTMAESLLGEATRMEKHLATASNVEDFAQSYATVTSTRQEAQVHATLAAAAAQAMPAVSRYIGDSEQITEWAQVIGWSRLSPQDEAAELRAASGDEGPF